jgi:hypothetical protein
MAESKTELESSYRPTEEELETIKGVLFRGEELPTMDKADAAQMIAQRLAESETFEEAFAPQEDTKLPAWADTLMGVPVVVQGVRFNPSTKQGEGPSAYAVCTLGRLDNGDNVTVHCGGLNVMTQLVLMLEKGWMGNPVKLVARATGNDRETLYLERVIDPDAS